MTTPSGSARATRTPGALAAVTTPDGATASSNPGAYAVIGARNLFSPTRTEPTQPEAAAAAAAAAVRLNLFGVVLAGEQSIAYLEDPTTKRVFGYRLGDPVAGGTVRAIESDRVVLERLKQRVDIQLHDPSRPKPNVGVASAADGGDPTARAAAALRSPGVMTAPALPPGYRPPLGRTPLPRPGIVPPTRTPPASAIVPPITLESLPNLSGPGSVPANATSDDLSLQ